MKPLAVLGLLLLGGAHLAAQSLDELIGAALDRDPEYQRLRLLADRQELQYERSDHEPRVAVTLGSAGSASLAVRTDGGSGPTTNPEEGFALDVIPRISVAFPDGHQLSAQSTIAQVGDEPTLSPAVTYTWAPGPLGETAEDRLQDLERSDARNDTRDAIASRERAVAASVRSALRQTTVAMRQHRLAVSALSDAEEAFTDAQTLGNPSPGTAAYLHLQQQRDRAERALVLRETALEDVRRDLQQLVGYDPPSLGGLEELAELPAIAPLPPDAANSADAVAAARNLALAEARLAEEAGRNGRNPPVLELSVGWSFAPETQTQASRQQLGAGVGLQFQNWQVGLDTDLVLGTDGLPSTTGLSLQWRMPDRRADSLDLALVRTDRDIAVLDFQKSQESLRDELENMAVTRRQLEEAALQLTEDELVLELEITEARQRVQRGLASASTLEDLDDERQRLAFDRMELALDILDYNAAAGRLAGVGGNE